MLLLIERSQFPEAVANLSKHENPLLYANTETSLGSELVGFIDE